VLLLCLAFVALQLFQKFTRSSIYLLLFIVSGFIFVGDTSGYIHQYIWPNQFQIMEWFPTIVIMLPLIFYFMFIAHTLRLKHIAPYLYYFYVSVILSASLTCIASFYLNSSLLILVLSPISALAIIITIYTVLSQNRPLAKLYTTSLAFHLILMNILAMLYFYSDMMPIHAHGFSIMKLGFVIEVIIFIILLVYRTQLARRQYKRVRILFRKQKRAKTLAFERMQLMDELVVKKNELLTNVSHELRTPLTVLKLQVESLQHQLDKDVESSYQALADKIVDIERLISDIYQLAKSDTGALDLHFSQLDFP
jgi:signal transduction histidine kinase